MNFQFLFLFVCYSHFNFIHFQHHLFFWWLWTHSHSIFTLSFELYIIYTHKKIRPCMQVFHVCKVKNSHVFMIIWSHYMYVLCGWQAAANYHEYMRILYLAYMKNFINAIYTRSDFCVCIYIYIRMIVVIIIIIGLFHYYYYAILNVHLRERERERERKLTEFIN